MEVMSLENRIKELRKKLKLTQTEFGNRIGVKGNTITGYETGIRSPSEAVIVSICREFNVSENWLRTGEGEMFIQMTQDEEIAAFMGDVMAGESDNFRRRFIAMLSRLNADQWELLEQMVNEMSNETKKD